MHPEAAEAVEALVRERFEERGIILVRFGRAPKRAILLRTNPDEAFGKLLGAWLAPTPPGGDMISPGGNYLVRTPAALDPSESQNPCARME